MRKGKENVRSATVSQEFINVKKEEKNRNYKKQGKEKKKDGGGGGGHRTVEDVDR